MAERISVDTRRYNLLEEPGLRPPDQRWTYATPEVQELVRSAFGDMLPTICFDEDKRPYYEHFDDAGNETAGKSTSITKREEVPRSEVIRLLESILRLQAMAQDPNMNMRLQGVAATFRLPHPAKEKRSYRIYTDTNGYKRLHVLWGFGGKASEHTTVTAAKAVAILLDTTTDELGEVAERECSSGLAMGWAPPETTGVVTIPPEGTGATAPLSTSPLQTVQALFRRPLVRWGSAAAAVILVIIIYSVSRPEEPKPTLKKATPEETEAPVTPGSIFEQATRGEN